MTLHNINYMPIEDARSQFMQCCTASAWVEQMIAGRPFTDTDSLFQQANNYWENLTEPDYLEAFSGHPKIGDLNSLREKYACTKRIAGSEQAGINNASEQTLQVLADGNHAYEQKFGFIFIVCATGKTAGGMLKLLQQRLLNDRNTELKNAAEEQRKITRIRLEKLL